MNASTKKTLFRLTLAALLFFVALFGYFAYVFYLTPDERIKAEYLIPGNAIYIFETQEPIENWKEISSHQVWAHLKKNAYFAEMTAMADGLDQMIKDNDMLFSALGKRSVYVSAHMTQGQDYDFLYIADLQRAAKVTSRLEGFIANLTSGEAYRHTTRQFEGQTLHELFDKQARETLYFCFIQNLFVASYDQLLLEKSILEMKLPTLGREPRFVDVQNSVYNEGMFRIFVQYGYLDEYLETFTGPNPYVDRLSEQLLFTGSSFAVNEQGLLGMKGYTNTVDTVASALNAMLESDQGRVNCPSVVPKRTAFLMSLGFKNFNRFYDNLLRSLSDQVEDYEAYMENVEKVEKFLGIDLERDFVSWVGNEIAFVQTQPTGLGESNEFAAFFKAEDLDEAKERLAFIEERIRKRSPVKFRGVDYKGYPIRYMSVKGFFKLVIGGMFAGLEKPYYTFVGDYVVFSNHPQTLRSVIDDYESGNTLEKDERFAEFFKSFQLENNAFLYVNTPTLHESMREFVTAETWADMRQNRDYIVAFEQIGFQLTGDGDGFDTRFYSQYRDLEAVRQEQEAAKREAAAKRAAIRSDSLGLNQAVAEEDEEEVIDIAEDIYVDDMGADEQVENYPDGTTRLMFEIKNGVKHGRYYEYYPSGALKVQGRYRDGEQHGTWRFYDEEGNRVRKERFRDGKKL